MSYVNQMSTLGVIVPQRGQYSTNSRMRQASQNFSSAPRAQEQMSLQESEIISRLNEALVQQRNQFERFKYLTEQKFTTLSKDLMQMNVMLREAHDTISKYKDKIDVQESRAALRQYQQGDTRQPMDQAIDRNGVAPKDVQITDVFNCSGKRF